MAMTVLHDYKREWENYQNAREWLCLGWPGIPKDTLSQRDFAEALGVTPSTLARHFAPFNEAQENEEIRATLKKIARSGNNKVSTFIESFVPTELEEVATLSKISLASADRIGFSPQASIINMTQQNVQALVIPPLFASEEAQNLKTMMGE